MTWRRALRYGAVVFAALAFAQGVRAWEAAHNEVLLVYEGQPGALTVTLLDDSGTVLRRTTFGGAERSHRVNLPKGEFVARLQLGTDAPVERRFAVTGDQTIPLSLPGRPARR